MKIFSAAQIKACDAYTIHAAGLNAIDLIERAAQACAHYIFNQFGTDTPFVILCGMGNNGADGLALAHLLLQNGYGVKVFVLQHRDENTPSNKTLLNKILRINAALVDYVAPETYLTDLPKNVVIVDAILGTGLNKELPIWMTDFFAHINILPNYKIAIDIPSGMPADTLPDNTTTSIIACDETLSFQFYKRSFLHPETGPLCGSIKLLDIGLHPTFINATHTHYHIIEHESAAKKQKAKAAYSYKNQHGHCYLIGGSKGKSGAAILATKAALRSGCGLVTSIIPEQSYLPLQIAAPEAMCSTGGENHITQISDWDAASALGIGMGMGTHPNTATAFANFVENCTLACVFDADALNLLAAHPELLNKIPENSILTPHVGECDRLFGVCKNSIQRVENIRLQAMRYKVCIVLKGHRTVIATPEGDCYYNINGNAGMAKAGSGDVLTGLLAGLLAQGYKATDAAIIGVFLHGLAGDLAAKSIGQQAMTANDIIQHFSTAWQKLSKA